MPAICALSSTGQLSRAEVRTSFGPVLTWVEVFWIMGLEVVLPISFSLSVRTIDLNSACAWLGVWSEVAVVRAMLVFPAGLAYLDAVSVA